MYSPSPCLYLCLFTHAASSLTLMHEAPPSRTARLEEKISHRKDGRQTDEGAEMKPGLGQPERGRGVGWGVVRGAINGLRNISK